MQKQEEFSIGRYLNEPAYKNKFSKYFNQQVLLDTFGFCLLVMGKFDINHHYDTLGGCKHYFMNVDNYRKLLKLLQNVKGKLIITPSVLGESIPHIAEEIEKKYRDDPTNRKIVETEFANFLQNEIKIFEERHPRMETILNHGFVNLLKHKKLRDRFELGELSLFVETEKAEYSVIITNDSYKTENDNLNYAPSKTIIVQLSTLNYN